MKHKQTWWSIDVAIDQLMLSAMCDRGLFFQESRGVSVQPTPSYKQTHTKIMFSPIGILRVLIYSPI